MGIMAEISDTLLSALVREKVPWLENIDGFISACKNNDIESVDIESFRYPLHVAFASEEPATKGTETVLGKGAVEAQQGNCFFVLFDEIF